MVRHSPDHQLTLARVLMDEIICHMGYYSRLSLSSNICRLNTDNSIPNGRFNCTLEAKLVNEDQRNWDQHIPKVLFAYSRHVDVIHESTGYSVNFGRSPTLPVDIILGQIPERDGNNPSSFCTRNQQFIEKGV